MPAAAAVAGDKTVPVQSTCTTTKPSRFSVTKSTLPIDTSACATLPTPGSIHQDHRVRCRKFLFHNPSAFRPFGFSSAILGVAIRLTMNPVASVFTGCMLFYSVCFLTLGYS